MRVSDIDILMVPGWMNSGPDHWQSRWESKLSTARRVIMPDFARPVFDEWKGALLEAIDQSDRPILLVAHSLGSLVVANVASLMPSGKVIAAWLAAPPDIQSSEILAPLKLLVAENEGASMPVGFGVSRALLPFPSLLIASRNDPFCSFERAALIARDWGAELVDAGEAGHINSASGYGPWPDGVLRLAAFLRDIRAPRKGHQ